MTTTTNTTTTETTPSPQYEADARTKIAALRAMAAEFASPEPRSLSPAEQRVVNGTPRAFVEKAANFGPVVPGLSQATNADFDDMRDGEAYAKAYGPLIDELGALRQLVRKAVALRRIKSARSARSIYRLAKTYVTVEGGDDARTHVQEMKKALRRRPRAGAAQTPPVTPPVTK